LEAVPSTPTGVCSSLDVTSAQRADGYVIRVSDDVGQFHLSVSGRSDNSNSIQEYWFLVLFAK
jgi:hypothetical protein